MRYPSAFIDEIKYRNDIQDVISSYVTLKRAGSNYNGLCPFHNEKTPSFTVFPSTSNFYCFGCGTGGDVISFVMKAENLDYPSAIQHLAKRAGLAVPAESGADKTLVEKRTRMYSMNREAAKYFHRCLYEPIGQTGLSYLRSRGIPEHGITHFGLGFAPDSFGGLTDHLRRLGYTEQELIDGFLCGRSKKNGKLYDYFRNRVIFPIIDTAGNIVAFGGRVMDHSEPKYLNSSDTPAFKKSRQLFALNFARQHCKDYLIMCEGYMDVIAMHMAGFENAVATLGTAVTQEHARIISKYTGRVILAYDSDAAGKRAADKAIGLLKTVGVEIQILQMNGAKDPDEYIQKFGAEKFKLLLNESMGQQDYLIQNILARYDISITSDRIHAADEMAQMLAGISASVERDVYIGKAAALLEVSREALASDVKRKMRRDYKQHKAGELRENIQIAQGTGDRLNPDSMKNRRAAKAEEQIIGILELLPELIPKISEAPQDSPFALQPGDFFSAFHKRLYELIIDTYQTLGTFQISYLGEALDSDEMSRAMALQIKRQKLRNDETVLIESIAALHSANHSYAIGHKESIDLDDLSDILQHKRKNDPTKNTGKDE